MDSRTFKMSSLTETKDTPFQPHVTVHGCCQMDIGAYDGTPYEEVSRLEKLGDGEAMVSANGTERHTGVARHSSNAGNGRLFICERQLTKWVAMSADAKVHVMRRTGDYESDRLFEWVSASDVERGDRLLSPVMVPTYSEELAPILTHSECLYEAAAAEFGVRDPKHPGKGVLDAFTKGTAFPSDPKMTPESMMLLGMMVAGGFAMHQGKGGRTSQNSVLVSLVTRMDEGYARRLFLNKACADIGIEFQKTKRGRGGTVTFLTSRREAYVLFCHLVGRTPMYSGYVASSKLPLHVSRDLDMAFLLGMLMGRGAYSARTDEGRGEELQIGMPSLGALSIAVGLLEAEHIPCGYSSVERNDESKPSNSLVLSASEVIAVLRRQDYETVQDIIDAMRMATKSASTRLAGNDMYVKDNGIWYSMHRVINAYDISGTMSTLRADDGNGFICCGVSVLGDIVIGYENATITESNGDHRERKTRQYDAHMAGTFETNYGTGAERTYVRPENLDSPIGGHFTTGISMVPSGTYVSTPYRSVLVEDITKGDTVLGANGYPVRISSMSRRHVTEDFVRINAWGLGTCDISLDAVVPVFRGEYAKGLAMGSTGNLIKADYGPDKAEDATRVAAADVRDCDWVILPGVVHAPHVTKPVMAPSYDLADYVSETGRGSRYSVSADSVSKRNMSFKRHVSMDKNLAYLIGFYLADGSSHNGTLSYALNSEDTEYMEKLKLAYATVFGNEYATVSTVTGKGHAIVLAFPGLPVADMVKSIVPETLYEKHVPDFFFHMPEDIRKHLLIGLIDGDGSIKHDRLQYTGASLGLVSGVRQLLFGLGGLGTLNKAVAKRTPDSDETTVDYVMKAPKSAVVCDMFGFVSKKALNSRQVYKVLPDGYVAARIRSVQRYHYEGDAYAIETEGNRGIVTTSAIMIQP